MSGKALASFFLFSCSLNMIPFCAPIFRGNGITKNSGAYREIPSFVPELFAYSHTSNDCLFSGKNKALGRKLKKYDIFTGTAWTDNSEDLMIHALI